MSPAHTVRIIAAREAGDRLRNKAFTLGTLVMVALVLAAVVIPTLFDDGPERHRLGVVGEVPEGFADVAAAELAQDEAELEVTSLADRQRAATAVEDGEVDAALLEGRELMTDGSPSTDLRVATESALQQLAVAERLEQVELSEQQLAEILAPRQPLVIVGPGGEEDEGAEDAMIAFVATIVLFLTIQINANSLLTGSIEEKSSRVVEVLLGAVRPAQLLAGKLIALTALSLGQIALVVAVGLGANGVVDAFEPPPATWATAGVALLMVVLGFAFYAALYTAAGAMASSVEDAQATAGPLAFVVVTVYVLTLLVVVPSPGGTLAQVLTYLPPAAPFAVPARVALEAIPGWQVVLASSVTLLGTVATIRLAGRLYSAAVLAGGKLTWRDAWRAEPIR